MANKKAALSDVLDDFRYFDDLPCGIVIFLLEKGRDLVPVYRNAWYRRLFGYASPRQAALKDNIFARIFEDDRERFMNLLKASAEGRSGEMQARLQFDDKSVIRVHLRVWCLERDYELPRIGLMITGADNEEQVDPIAATYNQFYKNIARNEALSSFDYDIEQDRFFYILRKEDGGASEHIVDHYLETLRNRNWVHNSTVREYRQALAGHSGNNSVEFLGLRKDGAYEWRRAEFHPAYISEDGNVSMHMIGTIEPMAGTATTEVKTAHMDAVTGLQDHYTTMMTIEWILEARDESERAFALFRLNGLNQVDQYVSDEAGDELLHHLGDVLARSLQGQDVIGRYSGSVIAVFIRHADDRNEINGILAQAQEAIEQFLLRKVGYPRVGVTAGIAYMPEDGTTLEDAEAVASERLDDEALRWQAEGEAE